MTCPYCDSSDWDSESPIAFDCGRDDEVDSIVKEIIDAKEPTDNYGLGIEYTDDSEDD